MKRAVVFLLVALAATAEPTARFSERAGEELDGIFADLQALNKSTRQALETEGANTQALLSEAQIELMILDCRATTLGSDHAASRAHRLLSDIICCERQYYGDVAALTEYRLEGNVAMMTLVNARAKTLLETVILSLVDEYLWARKCHW